MELQSKIVVDLGAKIEQAEANLQRQLDWIGRYDTRIAFTAGFFIAMLGVLANTSKSVLNWNWYVYIIFGLSAILLFVGLLLIYLSQYPNTESRNLSLIYFGTIADLKCDDFQKSFREMNNETYLNDILSQVHINAQILVTKFNYLKYSLRILAVTIIPWITAIYLSGIYLK